MLNNTHDTIKFRRTEDVTNPDISVIDLGIIEYSEALDKQREIFNATVEKKLQSQQSVNHLIFCEHPHVFTLGKSGNPGNLLKSTEFLASVNAVMCKTDRGGDITYHGPGQIVGYPIFNLDFLHIGIKMYVYKLEEAVINTLKEFEIDSGRIEGATGVWVQKENIYEKICAIGIRASRGVTMHGLALNVNTNLSYFSYINPCGFIDKGVTSMKKEKGEEIELKMVKRKLQNNIFNTFGF